MAVKLISSSRRSITVWRRRAPIFSTERFTSAATWAISAYRVLGEVERHVLGPEQRHVLADQAGLGLGEDAPEVLLGERLELDPDRQAALQLG